MSSVSLDAVLQKRSKAIRCKRSSGTEVGLASLLAVAGIGWFLWQKRRNNKQHAEDDKERGASAGASGRTVSQHVGSPSASSARQSSSRTSSRQRQQQAQKPKTKKELRQEKRAAKKQLQQNAEDQALAQLIGAKAKAAGIVSPTNEPEPPKHYVVDYDGVDRGYDKIVEWQQTGKKKY